MTAPHIGTLREKPLHASLKQWYAQPGDQTEVAVDGFVIDIVREETLIEIQTRGFSSIKRKVSVLLDRGHRLVIVHPIAVERHIVKLDPDGTVAGRRRSPRHGTVTDVFGELVSFPALMTHPGLELDVVLTVEEEYRTQVPGRSWRRNGWTVLERRLVDVIGSVLLRDSRDLASLLPDGLADTFTTADLAERLGRPRRLAQQMAFCLRLVGAIESVGKRGNSVEFRVSTPERVELTGDANET